MARRVLAAFSEKPSSAARLRLGMLGVFGLAFALDQVRRDLEDLADRVPEWTLPRRAQPATKAEDDVRALAHTRR